MWFFSYLDFIIFFPPNLWTRVESFLLRFKIHWRPLILSWNTAFPLWLLLTKMDVQPTTSQFVGFRISAIWSSSHFFNGAGTKLLRHGRWWIYPKSSPNVDSEIDFLLGWLRRCLTHFQFRWLVLGIGWLPWNCNFFFSMWVSSNLNLTHILGFFLWFLFLWSLFIFSSLLHVGHWFLLLGETYVSAFMLRSVYGHIFFIFISCIRNKQCIFIFSWWYEYDIVLSFVLSFTQNGCTFEDIAFHLSLSS